ncbi:MAG: VanW family protein [Clostridia bacterium]|nr:VanW family protein [Clostridia bacterium]
MKKFAIVLIIIVAVGIGTGIWIYNQNSNKSKEESNNNIAQENESNYQAERSDTNITNQNANKDNKDEINKKTEQENVSVKNNIEDEIAKPQKQEVELANFTTKIYNKEGERQNNISITCQSLTNTEIKPGETFSFCNTVGKATTAKGYQKADIYVDGEKKQGLGGGNCQVSTTLYNAVAKIPELEVVERHQHSGYVPYIKKGQDAAVAYGAYDFKFKNNTQNTIKIVMETTPNNIVARLLRLG